MTRSTTESPSESTRQVSGSRFASEIRQESTEVWGAPDRAWDSTNRSMTGCSGVPDGGGLPEGGGGVHAATTARATHDAIATRHTA